MKARDVALKLVSELPSKTSLFCSTLNVTSLTFSGTVSGGTVTAVTSTPHGLTVENNLVVISGALVPNPITSLTQTNNVAFATTEFNHDLTEGYQENVTIKYADNNDYNGIHPLLSVPNRRNFTYEINGNPPSPDTGTPILLEDLAFGYNGMFQVTVIDDVTFTYELDYGVGSPAQGNIVANCNVRIAAAVSLERANQEYSRFNTNELWAFVVLEDTTISKDRYIKSDLGETFNSGSDFRQIEMVGFSVYVFAPSTFELGGNNVRDLMEDVRVYLYKSLLRVKFPTGLLLDAEPNALFMTTAVGHYRSDYNLAYYIHQFRFESRADIIYADTVGPDVNVAFRDIDFNIYNNNNVVIAHTPIDLDDVPL